MTMKDYRITIDVTMSGDIYISAETEEDAIAQAKKKYFNARDLQSFHFLSSDIYEIEESEE